MSLLITLGLGSGGGGSAGGTPVDTPSVPAPPAWAFSSSLAPVEADLGSDVLVFPDLDETFTLVSDGRVLAEALARRLLTPKGMNPFHTSYGKDIRAYLLNPVSDDLLFRARAEVEAECEQDERVLSAAVSVRYLPDTQALKFSIEALTAEGPFRFTLKVSALSIELLASED